MRPVLVSLLALATAHPALAQDGPINPYTAALDGMPLSEARPGLEAAYGALHDTTSTMDPGFTGEGVAVLITQEAQYMSAFLFCHDKLAGVTALIPTQMAADVLLPLTTADQPSPEIYASGDGITLMFPEAELSLQYWGIGTKSSYVSLSYPSQLFLSMNFGDHCAKLADS